MKKQRKIFISTFPYCRVDRTPLELLESLNETNTEYTIQINPLGRKLKPKEVAEFARDADAVIAGTEDLTELVTTARNLKIISRVGIGLDSVPLELCKSKGIAIAYTPDAVSPAVSEMTIGLMVDLFRKLSFADREMRAGEWSRPYGTRIGVSDIGILGMGRIGTRVVQHLLGFQPNRILIHDLLPKEDIVKELQDLADQIHKTSQKLGKNWNPTKIQLVDEITLFKESDCITVHVPLQPNTKNLITKHELALMKNSAFLINTARGGIINEADLYTALKENDIAGAAIDVFEEEPYTGEFLELENTILTQHMGSCSEDCRADMEREAAEEVVRFFQNQPLANPVI